MMFLSRSVWMSPDSSVCQCQTRSPTSPCRSVRMSPGRTAKLFTRRSQLESAGRSQRRFVKMDIKELLVQGFQKTLYLFFLDPAQKLLMLDKNLKITQRMSFLKEVKS